MHASDDPLSPFTRQRIARLTEDALRRAGVVGEFPTPIEAVQVVAGVRDRVDISRLPKAVVAKKPSRFKRWLGAIWFEERTVFIDTSQPEPRVLFTDAHEATHALCGWHEAILRLDTEDELFRQLGAGVEAEANYGAGLLIFQGGRFHREALKDQVSIRAPLALADDYGASRHAAVHFYVQEHPDAVALVVAGRYRREDGTLPIWRTVESQTFLKRFGRVRNLLPAGQLSISSAEAGPLAEIVVASRSAVDPPTKLITVRDKGGTRRPFFAEAFFNGYTQLVVLVDAKARRLGRRARLVG